MGAIPETFKEICESVLGEADGRGVQLASVALGRDSAGDLYVENPTHRNVISWVANEYLRIQLETPRWTFLHKRGKFLSLAATKSSYKKSGVRRVDDSSLYFQQTGQTQHLPMYVESYDWWQLQERDGVTANSPTPTTLIEAPGDEYIIWPTPTLAGGVYGDWQIDPHQLINADDQPCWDTQYNPLIKWGVLEMYAAEFAGEESAKKLIPRAKRMLPTLRNAFDDEYRLPVYGAPTLF